MISSTGHVLSGRLLRETDAPTRWLTFQSRSRDTHEESPGASRSGEQSPSRPPVLPSYLPVPANATVCGLWLELLSTFMVAVRMLAAPGVKVTEIVQ